MAGLLASIAAAKAPTEVPAIPEAVSVPTGQPESLEAKLRRLGVGLPA
jgi:hypothetical protein